MNRSFGTEDSSSFLRVTSTNPVSLFGRNEPPSRFPERLQSEGYDEYFDPPLENKYECPICLLGLREPVQTLCGHRFCRGCILRSIRDAGPKCPVDNEHLDEWQLNPDNFARREMLNHTVFCRFKKLHECPWKGPLSKLEDHLKECDFVAVSCPKNCGMEFQRKDLKKHLEDDCPNRTIPCTVCAEEVLWNSMENHFQDCPQYPLSCEKCGKENIPRNEMQDHNEKECPTAELKCPFNVVGSPFEGARPAVNEHVKEKMLSHLMDLTKEFGQLRFEQPGLQATKSRSRRTRGGVEAQEQASEGVLFNNLAALCQRQQTEIDGLRDLVNEMTGTLERLERRLNESRMRVETPLQELSIRLNRQETRGFEFEGRVCNGSYTWKIENYRQRRQDAISGIATALHGPAFYTSLYGYKLCLRINLNGVDSGVGRYIALFVHMMQGDYDSILEWPFTGRITLAILDQSEGTEFRQHISETLIAKPSLLAFQRPTAPRNYKGYGYVEFAPIEHICDPQYIKNNTMLARIQIDH
ncbi:PREDICTED: TNF receptor-associated factor 6-like isoform X11 [Acropora digitifera]|uniref:TNF receptor-associated factor 6-like isoform X11 n=1 Tax=Acropora digitifera TaxID=70779 RepID=UPI00077ACBF7|nr:PREDICTED: TNF receptor-associated factor 6-like isoform X11 [Acropora digitifera]